MHLLFKRTSIALIHVMLGISLQAQSGKLPSMPSQTAAENRSETIQRDWKPSDSIKVRYFNVTNPVVSPDGNRFFIVYFHGDLDNDRVIYEMCVFSTEEVKRSLAVGINAPPERILKRGSAPGRIGAKNGTYAIFNPQWNKDSQAITFRGIDGDRMGQMYELDVVTGSARALTRAD